MKYQRALWTTEEASPGKGIAEMFSHGGKKQKLWNLTDPSLGSGCTIYHFCDLFRSLYLHAYLELQRVGHD